MSNEQLQKAFATIDTQHPFWKAVQAALDEAVEQEQMTVAQPDSTDGARHYNAGRLAHALDFRTALNSLKQNPPDAAS